MEVDLGGSHGDHGVVAFPFQRRVGGGTGSTPPKFEGGPGARWSLVSGGLRVTEKCGGHLPWESQVHNAAEHAPHQESNTHVTVVIRYFLHKKTHTGLHQAAAALTPLHDFNLRHLQSQDGSTSRLPA